ncbi:hypothetical protein [Enemella evansiae]|uniref:hypothetical protein n=1 Tax=Enemella evansiae TaxID=2016499 RepID=UPI001552C54E|nr:hypothetical protein [Enemella evansiae]
MSNSDYYQMQMFHQRENELLAEASNDRLARQLTGRGWLRRLFHDLVGGHGERPPGRRPAHRPVGAR